MVCARARICPRSPAACRQPPLGLEGGRARRALTHVDAVATPTRERTSSPAHHAPLCREHCFSKGLCLSAVVTQLNYHTHFTCKGKKRNPACNVVFRGRASNPLLPQVLRVALNREEAPPVPPNGIASFCTDFPVPFPNMHNKNCFCWKV